MPAINPARLKNSCSEIGEYFSNPQQFVAELHNLLNFYANRVRRPGEAGTPPPLSPAYHAPPPVLRHLDISTDRSATHGTPHMGSVDMISREDTMVL